MRTAYADRYPTRIFAKRLKRRRMLERRMKAHGSSANRRKPTAAGNIERIVNVFRQQKAQDGDLSGMRVPFFRRVFNKSVSFFQSRRTV